VIFLLGGLLRGRRVPAPAPAPLLSESLPRRMPLPRAAALALAITLPLCLFFALRTSLFIAPLLALILWRGVGPRLLAAAAAALLGVVVPIIYLVAPVHNQGGYDFGYSTQLIAAHWTGVVAVLLLAVAAWRMLLGASRGRGEGPGRPPAGDVAADFKAEPDERELELAGAGRSSGPGCAQPAGRSNTAISTARAR